MESISSHPQAPFHSYISGVGVIEASSDNISIGVPVNGIVEKVAVSAGEAIKKGNVLFSLENQDLQADLKAKRVDYEIAQAKLQKLQAMPRKEDAAAASALLKNVRLEVEQTKNLYESVQELGASRAMSLAEINRRRFAFEQALARLQEAEANEEKIKRGAWKPDLDIAFLEVELAKASIERVEAAIHRTIIRSPIDGKVLQIKIHEGESTAEAKGPLMIVGNTEKIYLKVSINQFDAPFFQADAPAVAYLRGSSRIEFQLEFVRLEPYLVNKQNFTNEVTETVDTRVLQVIYLIKNRDRPLFVGQQMDVFIQAHYPI